MFRVPRLLAPLSVAAVFAVAAPAAHAVDTVNFPDTGTPVTTVTITDPSPASPTVHLTVTAATPSDLVHTKVFLGANATLAPFFSIGIDGVRDSRYDNAGDDLSTAACAVYGNDVHYDDVTVTTAGGNTFSADLPKGELIDFDQVAVAVGIVGHDSACTSFGFAGLDIDYLNTNQDITGFDWDAPAAPVVTATPGRRQVALSFDQENGTSYDIYRVVGGVRASTPVLANVRGHGSDVQVVVKQDADNQDLEPGTHYDFQVQATRIFDNGMGDLASPFSATAGATTPAVQTVQFGATPALSTTDRTAAFSWSITGNDAAEAPFCLLDGDAPSAAEVPCTTTGATLTGLALGAHSLSVYPADGEAGYSYAWTVVAVPVTAPPAPPAGTTPPKTPANPADLDGDGITNSWLIGGKAAPAPGTPKASVSGGKVNLKLPAAPKAAKSVRVYRADGNGGYKLVKTLTAKSKTFTDTKVKPGHSYNYKTVAVNAKGQQGKASGTAKVSVKKK